MLPASSEAHSKLFLEGILLQYDQQNLKQTKDFNGEIGNSFL